VTNEEGTRADAVTQFSAGAPDTRSVKMAPIPRRRECRDILSGMRSGLRDKALGCYLVQLIPVQRCRNIDSFPETLALPRYPRSLLHGNTESERKRERQRETEREGERERERKRKRKRVGKGKE